MSNIAKKDNEQLTIVAKTDSSQIWRRGSLVVLISQALAISATQSATIMVTSTNGTTGGSYCTLRDAITAANTDRPTGGCSAGSGADLIVLRAYQKYVLTEVDNITYDSVDTDNGNSTTAQGYNGLPNISTVITINGNASVINRESRYGVTPFRIFRVSKGGNLTLNKVSIRQGKAPLNNGGAIYIDSGKVSLNNSILIANKANYGGGISNRFGVVTINNSKISGNTSYYGGGIYNKGKLILNKSIVSQNKSTKGGGIYHDSNLMNLINNSIISGNMSTNQGGGIYHDDGIINIVNSTISGNMSTNQGGGIYHDDGIINIVNSIISGNTSGTHGGGIYHDDDKIIIKSSTISGNTAKNLGGGIYHDEGELLLEKSTISRNSARYGGGIYISDDIDDSLRPGPDNKTIIKNSTIFDNVASYGGGIYHLNHGEYATFLYNNIIMGNKAYFSGPECVLNGVNTVNIGNFFDSTPKNSKDCNAGGLDMFVPIPNFTGAHQFTVSAWVKSVPDFGKGCGHIINIVSQNHRIVLNLVTKTGCNASLGQFYSWILTDNQENRITSNENEVNYHDDQWHFVVFTYNGSRTELYVDLQLEATSAFSETITDPATAVIGDYLDLQRNHVFGGVINDIQVYNRALAEHEIQELFYACPPEQHATYSLVTNQLTIPFIDLPLLDPNTKQPTGEMAVFKGEFQVSSNLSINSESESPCENSIGCFSNQILADLEQFNLLPSHLQYVAKPSAESYCHAVYSPSERTLKIPFLRVPSVSWASLEKILPINVFEVSLAHKQMSPLDPGELYLKDYKHLYTLE